jgi:hypothetical protein
VSHIAIKVDPPAALVEVFLFGCLHGAIEGIGIAHIAQPIGRLGLLAHGAATTAAAAVIVTVASSTD